MTDETADQPPHSSEPHPSKPAQSEPRAPADAPAPRETAPESPDAGKIAELLNRSTPGPDSDALNQLYETLQDYFSASANTNRTQNDAIGKTIAAAHRARRDAEDAHSHARTLVKNIRE
jgi:hypothetical protein